MATQKYYLIPPLFGHTCQLLVANMSSFAAEVILNCSYSTRQRMKRYPTRRDDAYQVRDTRVLQPSGSLSKQSKGFTAAFNDIHTHG